MIGTDETTNKGTIDMIRRISTKAAIDDPILNQRNTKTKSKIRIRTKTRIIMTERKGSANAIFHTKTKGITADRLRQMIGTAVGKTVGSMVGGIIPVGSSNHLTKATTTATKLSHQQRSTHLGLPMANNLTSRPPFNPPKTLHCSQLGTRIYTSKIILI